MADSFTQSIVVEAGAAAAGARLDRVLAEAAPALSRSRIAGLIRAGQVRVGGATVAEPSRRIKPGERIELTVPPPEDATPQPQAIALDILFEDDDLIVLDKPAGLVVHPAAGNPDGTLVNALLAHCGAALSGIGGVRRPGIVHRLDKDTSGVMVCAKSDAAHAGLSDLFARHDIDRAYLAIVRGAPGRASGTVEGAIGRHPQNRKKMAVVDRGGKPALTRWRVERRFGTRAALVRCTLETGRTHQIRVHMAHLGHPLIGDPLYGRAGGRALPAFGRQALHATRLGFRHPVSGEAMAFETPPPADFASLTAMLEAD